LTLHTLTDFALDFSPAMSSNSSLRSASSFLILSCNARSADSTALLLLAVGTFTGAVRDMEGPWSATLRPWSTVEAPLARPCSPSSALWLFKSCSVLFS